MRSESPSKKRASGAAACAAVNGSSSRWTVLASAMGVMVSMACWAELAEGAAANLQRGAAGLHALEVEDVVDEADEAVGVGDGDAEEVERLGVDVADDAGGEQAERAADAGERRAQFVRDGGDELVFEGVELGALGELEIVLVLLFAGLCAVGRRSRADCAECAAGRRAEHADRR